MTDYTVVLKPAGLKIVCRADCDCTPCRADRGLEPLTTAELTAKREAKQGRR